MTSFLSCTKNSAELGSKENPIKFYLVPAQDVLTLAEQGKVLKKYLEKDYGEEPTFAASGNGGVWSSVNELWKYEQAIQQNIFLDSSWIKKSRTIFTFPNWKDSIPSFIGLCWFITEFENQKITGHTGSQGGFRSDYVWLPEKKLFYVILCNTPKPLMELRKSILEITLN